MEYHLPYGIKHFYLSYLPPDTNECALTWAREASTWFTYPKGTESRVSGWYILRRLNFHQTVNFQVITCSSIEQLCWSMLNTTPVPTAWAVTCHFGHYNRYYI